jgi:hypothetical protein
MFKTKSAGEKRSIVNRTKQSYLMVIQGQKCEEGIQYPNCTVRIVLHKLSDQPYGTVQHRTRASAIITSGKKTRRQTTCI